jgi:hypothetical protein
LRTANFVSVPTDEFHKRFRGIGMLRRRRLNILLVTNFE